MNIEKKPGIPLDPGHNPVTRTVVVAETMYAIKVFCEACEVSLGNRNRRIIPVTTTDSSRHVRLLGISGPVDVVFLGCDPRDPQFSKKSVMIDLDRLRSNRSIRKAWLHDAFWDYRVIKPDILGQEAREW